MKNLKLNSLLGLMASFLASGAFGVTCEISHELGGTAKSPMIFQVNPSTSVALNEKYRVGNYATHDSLFISIERSGLRQPIARITAPLKRPLLKGQAIVFFQGGVQEPFSLRCWQE